MISIRKATVKDIAGIMKFIDDHWRKGDTLAKDRAFFEWQFVRKDDVTIILAIDDTDNKIFGILGYLPYTEEEYPDCYITIWRVINSPNHMLGQKLVSFLYDNVKIRYSCSAGLRKKAIKLRALQGKKTVCMDHHYRLSPRKEYYIARIPDRYIPAVDKSCCKLDRISCMDEFASRIPEKILKNSVLKKDYKYIKHRYFDHPVYVYECWCIHNDDIGSCAVFFTREEQADGHKAWKLIDYYGDEERIEDLASCVDEIMTERCYEYIDVYSYGIEREVFQRGGFRLCDTGTENIIPNYFHPFLQENVDIYMNYPQFDGLKMFRGDGDQDRPCD